MAEIILHSKLYEGRSAIKLAGVSVDGQRHDNVVGADLSFGYKPADILVSFLLKEAPKMVSVDGDGNIVDNLPFPLGWFSERTFDCDTALMDDEYAHDREDWYQKLDTDCVVAMRQWDLSDGRKLFFRLPWFEINGQRISDFVSLSFHEDASARNACGDIVATTYRLDVEFCGFAKIEYE